MELKVPVRGLDCLEQLGTEESGGFLVSNFSLEFPCEELTKSETGDSQVRMVTMKAAEPMWEVTKLRRPYVVRKSRQKWSVKEHSLFVEALELFGRDWKLVTEHVRTKTRIQVRSHAQKYFIRMEKASQAAPAATTTSTSSAAPSVPPSSPTSARSEKREEQEDFDSWQMSESPVPQFVSLGALSPTTQHSMSDREDLLMVEEDNLAFGGLSSLLDYPTDNDFDLSFLLPCVGTSVDDATETDLFSI